MAMAWAAASTACRERSGVPSNIASAIALAALQAMSSEAE